MWDANVVLKELNKNQALAVTTTEGYVRVIAGAGSGKTKVLTNRYAYIANALGVLPEHILSVTFTNKAAQEMKKRIRAFMPDEDVGWIGTFHGVCKKILSFDMHKLNFPHNFRVIDEEDQKEILREIYTANNLTLKNSTFNKLVSAIEKYKSQTDYVFYLTEPEFKGVFPRIEGADDKENVNFIIKEYLIAQRRNYYLDFSDLINFVSYLLETDEEFHDKWTGYFEYIQVDEFQDVSENQYALVSELASKHGNLFIVGDPDQTIYSWRGADVSLILDFDKNFTSTTTIILDVNYRSTPEILKVGNSLIERNDKRIDKSLVAYKDSGDMPEHYHASNKKDESLWIAKRIKELVKNGENLNDIAVLYRANSNSRVIEEAFISKKIPYVVMSGTAFYKRKEIKDVLSYLQMVSFGDDASFLRTVNTPARGIGKTRLEYIRAYAKDKNISYYKALKENVNNLNFLTTGAADYVATIEQARERELTDSVLGILDFVLKSSGYECMLMTDGEQERLDNVSELKNSVKELENSAKERVYLAQYLNDVSLLSGADAPDKKQTVKLMTVHTAKGLEYKHVFVCQMNEGIFPSDKIRDKDGMEEERRLFYVACTRAMDGLYISESEVGTGDANMLAPSRFIFDIDKSAYVEKGVMTAEYVSWAKDYILSGRRTERKKAQSASELKFKEGDKIRHELLGDGVIVQIVKNAYVIEFEGGRTRTISAKATLTEIQ